MLQTLSNAQRRVGQNKAQGGFTLIELLVVIAIIAILAAIAIPQFNKYRKNAEKAAVESAVRNCITEIEAQYADNVSFDLSQNTGICQKYQGGAVSTISIDISSNSTDKSYNVTATGSQFKVKCIGSPGGSITCE
ncbi:hypothetical protein JCM14244_01840 [Venenivibrio stagnispumantis]|uniref:Type IV pilus assembly protein PilA n=1 Tax=Venenivibrio stagnispumantis TaxID=407998 RepID=A0AA46AE88_9AQUI|nr:prepilin-type N-terminal cleavage/methylation domain-containing protein [Venenivibrio stagnispumantis]SMP10722.1 type IV pilus assembly protein PilA [Venenivibrio stagnispumantis]